MTERQRFATVEARNRAIVLLACEGLPPTEIERRIDISRPLIYVALARAREAGATIPKFSTAGRPRNSASLPDDRFHINLPGTIRDALEVHAKARRMSATTLARKLLETIAEDDLVAAILDDGSGT